MVLAFPSTYEFYPFWESSPSEGVSVTSRHQRVLLCQLKVAALLNLERLQARQARYYEIDKIMK